MLQLSCNGLTQHFNKVQFIAGTNAKVMSLTDFVKPIVLYRGSKWLSGLKRPTHTQTERFYCVTSYVTEKLRKLLGFDRQ